MINTNKISERVRGVVENIRQLRAIKGYSQEFMAAKLRISQNAYSKVELGRSQLYVDRLLIIAEILEVDILLLLKNYPRKKS